jgi:hypothetical protein
MYRTQKLRIMFAAGIAAIVMVACSRGDYDEGTADTLAVGGDVSMTPATTRVGDILGNPAQYVGDTVTVEADVEEVLGTHAFLLDEDDMLTGGIDNDMMVFSPKAAQLQDIDDQWLNNKVRVTGVVRLSGVADVKRDIDWDLTPTIESKFEGGQKPVLIAHRVERVGMK